MRNLKKFLALVMAMVMALSLMVTVNAANPVKTYPDADQVTEAFEEAVDVLTGMKVFQGDGDSFYPARSITRAETAALIYRLATGDTGDAKKDLYKDYGSFPDVHSTDWFAGYVGYCANAGYIKGRDDGRFDPQATVTGYEVLAMVLRAVGYDKNGEFTGAAWQTNVSARSTQLGILSKVKSTDYGDRLYEASRRDVVASILFESAQIPMVTYTEIGGYSQYRNLVSNEKNDSLGYLWFGLTDTIRIVAGNQATGEDCTVLGPDKDDTVDYKDETKADAKASWTMYDYPTVKVAANKTQAGVAINVPGLNVTAKTGLDLFGHKVKVWYNAKDSGTKTAYAYFDKAELAAVVHADQDSEKIQKTNADTAGSTKIAAAAKKAGFTIPADNNAPAFYESKSFSRLTPKAADSAVTAGTQTSLVWVLISNNDKKTVDVVIPVNTAAAQITKVNNWTTTKTITMDTTLSGTFAIDVAAGTPYNQDAITSDPAGFVVGNRVIATEITKNTKDDGTPVYWLDTVPAKTVTGTVVDYDFNATTDKATVTLSDGTVLKHTIIANAAITGFTGNYAVKNAAAFKNIPYVFDLDMQGNWLDARPVQDNSFIYGTYVDYSTTLGTSAFTYRMIGVGLDGNVVEKDFTKYTLQAAPTTVVSLNGDDDANKLSAMGMPYHNTGSVASSGYGSGLVRRELDDGKSSGGIQYKGFIQNDKLMDNADQTLYDIAGIQSLAGSETINMNIGTTSTKVYDFAGHATDNTVVSKDDVAMGVALVKTTSTASAASSTNPYLYLTEQTKFIIVKGYGTDSLKPVVYNGISELLGNASSVTINTDLAANAGEGAEILFTCENYQYSNTGVISKKVDTIFIPATALEYDNGSNLYFFHSSTATVTSNVKDAGGDAYRFEAYQGTEKVNVWVDKDYVDASGGKLQYEKAADSKDHTADTFLFLIDSGDKAADGQPIYTTKALAAAQNKAPAADPKAICYDNTGSGVAYKADTWNSQTALLGSDLVNVADAKVVNLDTDNGTIESMADLNHASSVCKTITVCVEYAEAGSKVVSAIYVIGITQA